MAGQDRGDAKFGNTIAGSRWFTGEPELRRQRKIPVEVRWICPHDGCGGEMKLNGSVWPMSNPGYHHTCDKCGFTAAVHARYPRIEYEDEAEESAPIRRT